MAQAKGNESGFEISAEIKDEDSDDDDSDEDSDELDETALEGFSTPLDEEDGPNAIDEYMVFQDVMQSKFSFLPVFH